MMGLLDEVSLLDPESGWGRTQQGVSERERNSQK